VFTGLELDGALFVTEASVMSIKPIDTSIYEISGLSSVIYLHQGALNKSERKIQYMGSSCVPLNPDGTSSVSDVEWVEVERLIISGRDKNKSFKLSQRELLDGILQKLATNASWRDVDYKVGTWVNASAAFQRWTKRGTMAAILDALAANRKTP
jgi:hypothetical protein